ncbi:maleate cis-trans isomerase family protein [Serinicoccus kebangsaanensis]|uniref:maleate cis-trans isomerase family protein n=1 Tax=Serinicoccus kebangsaanensis TaxID=2602069 RepID=UPI001EE3683B|nr:aspartate/glutamate racemase family protein [Serinicoccus kebangsaanensis]
MHESVATSGRTRADGLSGSERALREPGIGVVVPYDFALDRELWRWCRPGATLHLTRTPHLPLPVGMAQARAVRAPGAVSQATHDLSTVLPSVVAYGCTSGSFVAGVDGEVALREAIVEAGAPAAVTTSGAAVAALRALGVRRVAVVTPYDESVTDSLGRFLAQAGLEVVGTGHLGLVGEIWTVPEAVTADLVRRTVRAGAEAVFISCTNLRTYDILAPLEAELGIPVLSANQVTLWQALGAVGLTAVGPGQVLLEHQPAVGAEGTISRLDGEGRT